MWCSTGCGGTVHDQRAKRVTTQPVTTRQIADSLMDGDRRNHAIRAAEPLQLPDADLLVEPRSFGPWLGDGTTGNGGFTTADPELVDVFTDAGFEVKHAGGYA